MPTLTLEAALGICRAAARRLAGVAHPDHARAALDAAMRRLAALPDEHVGPLARGLGVPAPRTEAPGNSRLRVRLWIGGHAPAAAGLGDRTWLLPGRDRKKKKKGGQGDGEEAAGQGAAGRAGDEAEDDHLRAAGLGQDVAEP